MTRSTLPQYQRIADELRSAITSGQYPKGARLPTEHSLADAFGVCRMTVREGLKELQAEGMIVRKQGAGTIVQSDQEPVREMPHSFSDMGDLRESSRDSEITYLSSEERPLPPGLAARAKQRSDLDWLMLSGLRFFKSGIKPIAVSNVYISPELRTYYSALDTQNSPLFVQLEHLSGRKVEAVQQDICSLEADPQTAEKLQVQNGSAMLRVTRLFKDSKGRLIQISVTDHLANSFIFTSEISITQ
ncbi:GntR family transcriptional regulator [Erythrobacter sp. W53]|uniref:GntR family transcriptional regulator n=1 Tax=Erythrobacter sp. W53 TaxID=3425947 RepID=UPI003D7677BA